MKNPFENITNVCPLSIPTGTPMACIYERCNAYTAPNPNGTGYAGCALLITAQSIHTLVDIMNTVKCVPGCDPV